MIRGAYPTGWQGGGVYTGDNYRELLKYQIQLHREGEGVYSPDNDEHQFQFLDANRRFIQSILGDVAISEAFRIIGTGANNDFTIRGGDGTADGAFHFFLRGYHVIVETSTTYLTQNTDLNASLITAPTALSTPSGTDRSDEVYLEIFFLHIDGTQDNPLIPDNEATSKTNRLRLISQVLVAEGGTTPADFVDGQGVTHYTRKIATLERFDGQDAINAVDLTDVRISIDTAALAGNQEGAGKAPFNPSALKIFAQETPDDTVRIASSALMLTSDGLRVIDVLPQTSVAFDPASLSTKTRFYDVHINDFGILDIIIFSEVDTATADLFVDHINFNPTQRPRAIVRVDGNGAVIINPSDILDLPISGGGSGSGSGQGAPIEEFSVINGVPQEFFNIAFSAGSKNAINVYRNGQRLGKDDFDLPSPNQVQINTPSIPGTSADELIAIEPRTPDTETTNLEDFGVSVAGEGPTLKAPNADIYKLTVDNFGQLVTTGPI